MTHLHIRTANEHDVDAICAIYLASRRTFLPYAPMQYSDDAIRSWIAKGLVARGRTSVAVQSEVVVGFCTLSSEAECDWLDQLYLAPSQVGAGIGAALLNNARNQSKRPLRLYTFQQNEGARRFYERHGFRAVQFSDGSDNEEKCPDVLYELA